MQWCILSAYFVLNWQSHIWSSAKVNVITLDMYRKSYEHECISWFMGTSDVLKVLKIARAVGECNLRTFKTSRVTINHEMQEQVHTIFYLLYSLFFYNLVFKFPVWERGKSVISQNSDSRLINPINIFAKWMVKEITIP